MVNEFLYQATIDVTSIWSNKSKSMICWDSQCQVWTCDLPFGLRAGRVRSCLRVCRASWISNNTLTLSFLKLKKSSKKAHEILKSAYGNIMATVETVYKWYEPLRGGSYHLSYEPQWQWICWWMNECVEVEMSLLKTSKSRDVLRYEKQTEMC